MKALSKSAGPFAALALIGAGLLPLRAQVLKLNERQEIEVGKLAAAQVEVEQPVFTDAEVTAYVQKVGLRLARVSGRPGLRYYFKILQSDDVNAYALPGGYIYLTLGLVEAAGDEAELAAALAHEIGHIAARQHATKVRRSQLASLGVSFLGPVMGGGMRAAAAVKGGKSGTRGLFMRFSTSDEREADRMAAQNLYAAGYDPQAILRLLRRLTSVQEDGTAMVKRYFSSHATIEDRAENIEDLIATLPDKNALRNDTPEFTGIKARVKAVKPTLALTSSEAAAAMLEAAENAPDSQEARSREVAALYAPIFYQGIGDQPRYDYITNFDFDGDWRGDNNWKNAADKQYPLAAWVYYSVRETRTHYFLHYAAFHPRDYKGGTGMGKMFSKAIRTVTKPAASIDPTGRAMEAVLAHENDLEGCLVVVAKNGQDPRRGKVVFLETLAHNNFLKYLPTGEKREGFENFAQQGRRVKLFVEPKGHGIEAYDPEGKHARHRVRIFTFTGVAIEPASDQAEPVGYNLTPLATTLWAQALQGISPAFAETEDYGAMLLDFEDTDGVKEKTVTVGRIGAAFRGKVGGENLARAPWGWFDAKDKEQPMGQWFFDPARTIKRDFALGDGFGTAYLYPWPPEPAVEPTDGK